MEQSLLQKTGELIVSFDVALSEITHLGQKKISKNCLYFSPDTIISFNREYRWKLSDLQWMITILKTSLLIVD